MWEGKQGIGCRLSTQRELFDVNLKVYFPQLSSNSLWLSQGKKWYTYRIREQLSCSVSVDRFHERVSVSQDYYEILGVEKTASAEEIETAFRKLAMKFHPDRNPDNDTTAIFKLLNEAHDTLKDPLRRREYDRRSAPSSNGAGYQSSSASGGAWNQTSSTAGGTNAGGYSAYGDSVNLNMGSVHSCNCCSILLIFLAIVFLSACWKIISTCFKLLLLPVKWIFSLPIGVLILAAVIFYFCYRSRNRKQ